MKLSTDEERRILHNCLKSGNCNALICQYEDLIMHTIKNIAERKNVYFSDKDVEDLGQDVFVEIFRDNFKRLKAYEEGKCKGGLAGFIKVIASHTVLNHLAKTKDPFTFSSQYKMSSIDDDLTFHQLSGKDPDTQLDARQEILLIQDCLSEKKVSSFERLVFKLLYFKGLTFEQISESTGRLQGNIRTAKSRAISKIKKCLKTIFGLSK